MDNVMMYTIDKIKMFMIGEERNNAETIIEIMKKEGYEVVYLIDELDVLTVKKRKVVHFVKKKRMEKIEIDKDKQKRINGKNRI